MKLKNPTLAILMALVAIFSLPNSVQAEVYEPDTLIKTGDNPIVCYIASDGQKYAFPNEATYRSWYPGSTKTIKIISNTEMIKVPSGKAKTYQVPRQQAPTISSPARQYLPLFVAMMEKLTVIVVLPKKFTMCL